MNARQEILSKYKPFNPNQDVTLLPPMATLQQALTQRAGPLDVSGGQLPIGQLREEQMRSQGASIYMIQQDRHNRIMEDLKRQTENKDLTLHDLTMHRVKVAYRIVREIGRHLGTVGDDQTLLQATEPRGLYNTITNWECPQNWRESLPQENRIINPSSGITQAIRLAYQCAKNHPRDCPWQEVRSTVVGEDAAPAEPVTSYMPGVAILPPNPPRRWWNAATQMTLPEYDPTKVDHDPMLARYIRIVEATVSVLGIDQGSIVDRLQGIYGMMGLTDPWLCRLTFPSPGMLLAWESNLIGDVIEQLSDNSIMKVRKNLTETHGFQDHEREALIKMAKSRAVRMTDSSIEEEKSMMILQIESATQRARDQLNPRLEMTGLKLLSVVKGLGKIDPADAVGDFVKIVDSVNADRRLTGPRDMPQLPD